MVVSYQEQPLDPIGTLHLGRASPPNIELFRPGISLQQGVGDHFAHDRYSYGHGTCEERAHVTEGGQVP
jgi:hypothetical protein